MAKDKVGELIKIFDGNIDLALFYVTWIKNGLKAGKAYKELHPEVDEHSANTLGSRMLKKVEKEAILEAYGLDHELYFQQLKDGVLANKRDQYSGEMYPDHKTRKDYHDKLGRLLGIEGETLIQQNVQINVHPAFLDKYGTVQSTPGTTGSNKE